MKRITRNHQLAAAAAVALMTSALAHLPASAQEYQQSERQQTSGASTATGSISDRDRKFIREAAEGGMAEVRMGELGQEKANSADVKSLAKTLQTDHKNASDELADIAKNKGVELPTNFSTAQQSAISSLENKQGQDFDREFVQHTIQDHQKDIAAFERASRELDDQELKAFAQKTLPVLRSHLMAAEQASKNLGGTQGSGMQQ